MRATRIVDYAGAVMDCGLGIASGAVGQDAAEPVFTCVVVAATLAFSELVGPIRDIDIPSHVRSPARHNINKLCDISTCQQLPKTLP